jgi:hypothetical protein
MCLFSSQILKIMYEVWYRPIWGQMTRYCERVRASSIRQAEIKFYCTEAGDNCQEIIDIIYCGAF